MFLCYGALLPLILLLLMSSSALLPVLAGASVKSAKISADGSKQKTPTHLSFFVQKTLAVTMVPVAIIESLMVKRKSLFWIVLTFAVDEKRPTDDHSRTLRGGKLAAGFVTMLPNDH